MSIIDQVPSDRPMRERHRQALRRELGSQVATASRWRSRPTIIAISALTATLVGVGGAAAAGVFSAPAQPLGAFTTLYPPPFSASDYLTTNQWAFKTSTDLVVLYAGDDGQDPSQGEVIVTTFSLHQSHSSQGWTALKAFPTSSKDGILTMTGQTGSVLTLTAKDGATYYFDFAKDQFVSSP